jgi:hypothetical protein
MKVFLASILFAALSTGVAAKPSPFEAKPAPPAVVDDNALYLGPAGAMLESSYFGVQQPAGAGRVFPCRVRLHAIDRQLRFAQVCD